MGDCEDRGRAWSFSGIFIYLGDCEVGKEPGLFLGLLGDCEDRGRDWSLTGTVRMGAEPGLFLRKLGSVRTGAEPGLFLG